MQILSIQIDGPFLRAALIDKRKNKAEIRALKSAPLSNFEDVKRLYIDKGQIVSGLSGKDLFIRSIELKIGKSRHLEQALSFQSEATSHFSPEDVLHVPYFLKKEKKSAEALLFSASRQGLKDHLQQLEKWELDPDVVSAWSFGLVRYIQWKLPSLSNAFLVDLGSNEWTCVWMEKGEIKKSHTLEGGVETLLTAFWEDQKRVLLLKELEGIAKQADLARMKPPDLPSFYEKLASMRKELAKVLFSFHRLAGQQPIIFTGRIDAFLHFRNFLIEGFRETISAECNSSLPTEELKYAICIGLALDPSLNFRQGEFFPRKNWRKAGKNALLLLMTSLLLSGGFFFLGTKITHLRKEFLLSSLKTALHRWDPKLKKTLFSQSKDPEEILNGWTRSVQQHSKEYPYVMQAPKAAEVLSWLTSYPLQIKAIRYQLVEFPHIGSLKDPYRAKIELEFQTESPTIARQFHEFLLKEEKWIDPNEEISWEALNESYRASFFLKTKGPYVP